VPLLWDGIEGKEEREANSPSWFNADEAVRVLKHVKSLLGKSVCICVHVCVRVRAYVCIYITFIFS